MWSIAGLSLFTSLRGGQHLQLDYLSTLVSNFLHDNLTLSQFTALRPFRYQISRWELDAYSYLLVEKWMEEAGLHYAYYVSHFAPPHLQMFIPPRVLVEYILTNKRFSGDVSGIIGEALYLAYIEKVLGLDTNDTLHLRPYKGLTEKSIISMADFYSISTKLLTINSIRVPPNSIIIGEAKACTTPTAADIKEKIRKSFQQIRCTSRLLSRLGSPSSLAIISLALRDCERTTYKQFVLIVEV